MSQTALIQVIDPNWFMSATAQSSAALVGLFAAFLITKVVDQTSYRKEIQLELKLKTIEKEKLTEEIKSYQRDIDEYSEERAKREIQSFISDLEDETFTDDLTSQDLLELAEDEGYSWLGEEHIEKHYDELAKVAKRSNMPYGFGTISSSTFFQSPSSDLQYRNYLENINSLEIANINLSRIEKDFQALTKELRAIETSWLNKFLYPIGYFSLTGVFLPLLLMQYAPAVMYQWIPWVFTLVLVGWVWIFVTMVVESRS